MAIKNLIYQGKRYYHGLKTGLLGGWPAMIKNHHPEKKLKIIAITGTDGKTTTATLVYTLLKEAGYKVGLISTVAAYIDKQKIDTGFHVTSPHPKQLYQLMARMVSRGQEYLVLEITSQGAFQWRNWGVRPVIAGLTNIDREHLDYHLTAENYLRAKMLVLNSAKAVMINENLENFALIKKQLKKNIELVTFSKETRFAACLENAIRANFLEDYNRANAYLAVTIAKKLGIPDKELVVGLEKFAFPQGRMEMVPNKLGARIIVDFAHTPQALQAALNNIGKNYHQKGKLLVAVFGCAGLRDLGKRPVMGKIATELADMVVMTSEDPRTENIWSIIRQMKEEIAPHHRKVISIPNREKAIEFALERYGKDGNTVVMFGKGHEESMCYDGKNEVSWNDVSGSKKIIKRLEAKRARAS